MSLLFHSHENSGVTELKMEHLRCVRAELRKDHASVPLYNAHDIAVLTGRTRRKDVKNRAESEKSSKFFVAVQMRCVLVMRTVFLLLRLKLIMAKEKAFPLSFALEFHPNFVTKVRIMAKSVNVSKCFVFCVEN